MATTRTDISATRPRREGVGGPQDEPDAALGVDHAGFALRLGLAAQVPHEDVDNIAVRREVVAPDHLQQLCPGQDDGGVGGQDLEQVELASGQLDLAAGPGDQPSCRVHDQVTDDHGLLTAGTIVGARPAQQGVQACDELLQRERLHHVVVGARFQASDPVGHLVTGGEHADREVVTVGAQASGHGCAVDIGHADVEDHHVGRMATHRVQRRQAAIGRPRAESLQRQGSLQ